MTEPTTPAAAASAAVRVASAAKVDSPAITKLKAAATQFEAVFLRQMIGAMRSASLADGITDSSQTDQFRDMSDGKLADQMAGKGALHIADLLVKQYGARMAGPAAPAASPVATAAGKAAD